MPDETTEPQAPTLEEMQKDLADTKHKLEMSERAIAKAQSARELAEAQSVQYKAQQQAAQQAQAYQPPAQTYNQTAQPDYVDPTEQYLRQQFQGINDAVANQSNEMAVLKFKTDNQDWREKWEDIMAVVSDPQEGQEVAAFSPQNGQADYYRTLANAKQRVEIKAAQKAREEAESKLAEIASKQQQINQFAVVSGDSSESPGETIDLSNLSSDEMLDKGLVPDMDPNDPIRRKSPKG